MKPHSLRDGKKCKTVIDDQATKRAPNQPTEQPTI